ncbi:hypothetical protein PINS_up002024 [Pythium insidiosum]|nr:hypothetical protein PINS_up002024 [Pythium insidiosum]
MALVSCWGWGGNGQLGLGDRDSRIKPQVVRALASAAVRGSVAQVVCGSRFTVALTTRGALFAWGKNDYGQLGTGDNKAQIEPRMIEALSRVSIVSVATKGSHVLARTSEGALYTWGRGDEGQLGHGDRLSTAQPRLVQALASHHVEQICAGRSHSVAVTSDGVVFTWGSNEDGALGRNGSSVDDMVSAEPRPVEALPKGRILQVDCGSRHTIVLMADHRVFAWGWGIYGQLGLGDTQSQPVPMELMGLRGKHVQRICCGFRHSFAVLPRRLTRRATSSTLVSAAESDIGAAHVDVWAWGWNEYGQLGIPSTGHVVVKPTKVPMLCDIDLHLLAAGGRHSLCQIGIPAEDSSPDVGRARSCTDPRIRFKGTVQTLSWGRGSDGELGIGAVVTTSQPVSLPALHGR